jgi:hypothetical protein
MADPKRDLEMGAKYPYHGKPPVDWAEAAALGILRDLNDRRGIKHELAEVDDDVRGEIVETMAAIIRAARDAAPQTESTKEK